MSESVEKSTAGKALEVIQMHRVRRYTSDESPDTDDHWSAVWLCTGCSWKGDYPGSGDLHLAMEIGAAIEFPFDWSQIKGHEDLS